MARRKKPERFPLKGQRSLLHPCHLQGMQGDRFVRIANQVLRGQLTLLSFGNRFTAETPAGMAANYEV